MARRSLGAMRRNFFWGSPKGGWPLLPYMVLPATNRILKLGRKPWKQNFVAASFHPRTEATLISAFFPIFSDVHEEYYATLSSE
ncbi:unnamed protein product [Dovyalis caffra]|uniref:Uncharacterized protein n=1 Tax=Dovyalis caffra TaxID=77055 RepID=A0AAV1R8I0_9ROSI|nr:unnamed protein product [Dovyalis caffra]